ncbi:hypothetical protein IWQ60_003892 [Tieghemiomyces parasiticus]|uniref:Uncharacterized protein n=1 Tax=Tieghemiomyces parasiticus TaxID=78921 RepID=A0A9W8DZM3_9FUNG|nr:hypothetical protein IWQ60_003892 [Tieghemiomyces parasiticus]
MLIFPPPGFGLSNGGSAAGSENRPTIPRKSSEEAAQVLYAFKASPAEPSFPSMDFGRDIKVESERRVLPGDLWAPVQVIEPLVQDFRRRAAVANISAIGTLFSCQKLRALAFFSVAQILFRYMEPQERAECQNLGDIINGAVIEAPSGVLFHINQSSMGARQFYDVIPFRPLRFYRWILLGLDADPDCKDSYPNADRTIWRTATAKLALEDHACYPLAVMSECMRLYTLEWDGSRKLDKHRFRPSTVQDHEDLLMSQILRHQGNYFSIKALLLLSETEWATKDQVLVHGRHLGDILILLGLHLADAHASDDKLTGLLASALSESQCEWIGVLRKIYPGDDALYSSRI